jgi:putative ABC transport system permease protein
VLRLGQERSLLVASVRTVVQLLLLGLVLEWIFELEAWYAVVGWAVVMTFVAGLTAAGRTQRRFAGIHLGTVLSVWASSWLVTGVALMGVVQPEPWYRPEYAIPLLGMVLGNALNGVTLGLNSLTDALATRRDEVETSLALGATRWEAARGPVRTAVRTGMTPIINSMMIVGLVSLPGMMTGQLLTGVPPMEAVKYQIVIMFLVASATALGTVGVVLWGYFRLFSADHQFLYQRLVSKPPRTRS